MPIFGKRQDREAWLQYRSRYLQTGGPSLTLTIKLVFVAGKKPEFATKNAV
jgi:hypothetical protein